MQHFSYPFDCFGQMVRILRSVRAMGTSAGFAFVLHPFVEVTRDLRGRRGAGFLFR